MNSLLRVIENDSQNICQEIQRVSASLTSVHYMLTTAKRGAMLTASTIKGERMRLKETTFCLNAKPMKALLWCNKVPKGKRNKPAKINGVLLSDVQPFHEL